VSASFSEAELDVLMEAADLLMPADGSLPSVAESGLRDTYLDQALVARPDAEPILREFAREGLENGTAVALEHCRTHRPEMWDAVTTLLPGGYLLSPDVRSALGYRGQGPQLIPVEGRPDYDEFISVVIDRGPVFRPTPQQ
jgi:hypothetical protein